jgi:hypothetical protein
MSYLRVSYTDNDQFSDLVKKKKEHLPLKNHVFVFGKI